MNRKRMRLNIHFLQLTTSILRSQHGIALFMVLWVLVLLSVIAGEFGYTTRTELKITRNFKELTESYYLATAGINHAIYNIVQTDLRARKHVGSKAADSEAFKTFFASLLDAGQTQTNAPIELTESGDAPNPWRVNTTIPSIPYGNGAIEVRIENESGKININAANESMLQMVLNGFDLDEDEKAVIVDSILDWRDSDDFHRLNGAEEDYYQKLEKPYQAKNGPFTSLDELLLVRGVSPSLFYGGLQDMLTIYPESPTAAGATQQLLQTVQKQTGQSVNVNTRSALRININAASVNMLKALPLMNDALVAEIQQFRKEKDFKSLTELQEILGPDVYNAVSPYISLQSSPYYTISSSGNLHGQRSARRVQAVVQIDARMKQGYRILQWLEG